MELTTILTFLGSLALLMFGMKTLSDGLQKWAAPQLRDVLQRMTRNRLMCVLAGTFVTAGIQSSTATTLMTVSQVNAGLITLAQAIAIILGAHVGTTATAWVMSLGFTFDIGAVAYGAAALGVVLIYTKRHKSLGELLAGLSFLFLGVMVLRRTGAAIQEALSPGVLGFFHALDPHDAWTVLACLLTGAVLTLCVRMSAAIMALTMTLCSTGVLPVELGVSLVLGENVGTTVTSVLAARNANVAARRAAFSHMLVNVAGVCWVVWMIHPFFALVCRLVGCDAARAGQDLAYAEAHCGVMLAAFHTAFNVANTLAMVGLVPLIEKAVCRIVQPKPEAEDEESRLFFITSGVMQTPELSILNAKREIVVFGERCQKMQVLVQTLLRTEKKGDFDRLFARVAKYERITDKMEVEIAGYLNHVSEGRLSVESKTEIRHMLRVVSELESIGDACYNLARGIARRREQSKEDFTEKQYEHIQNMMMLGQEALEQMNVVVKFGEQRYVDLNKSYNLENEINNYRTQLKNQNILDINNRLYDYQIGVYYMDIIAECEKLGDYVVNVIEATGVRGRKV